MKFKRIIILDYNKVIINPKLTIQLMPSKVVLLIGS